MHGIASSGGKPNTHFVGSLHGVDSIEVSTNTAKIFQAWIEKKWFDERLLLLFGLYDLNSEFYATESSALFLNPAPGIGAEMAPTGLNGPSVFPTSSLGLRATLRPAPDYYVQTVLLDGVPGDPNNPRGTHIQFNKGDGTLWVAEAGYQPQREGDARKAAGPSKLALGAWRYSSKFPDLIQTDVNGEPLMRKGNHGAYLLWEQPFYFDNDFGFDTFLRGGVANAAINQLDRFVEVGVVSSGLIPGREHDRLGVSVSVARNGRQFRQAAQIAATPVDRAETAWELTYQARVNKWFSVQPNLQYVVNPGTDPSVENALVAAVRFEFSFSR